MMKTIILKKYAIGFAVVLLTAISCNKQPEGYTITGTISKDYGVDSVFIYEGSLSGDRPIKRNGTAVIDGKFTLKGVTDTIKHLYVGNLDKNAFMTLILDNDTFDVTLTDDEIKVEGGKINTMVLGYYNDKEYLALSHKNANLSIKAMNEEDEEVKADLIKKIRDIQGKMYNIEDNALYKVIDDANKPAIARLLALIHCQNFQHYNIHRRRELVVDIEKTLDLKYSKTINTYKVALDQMEKAQKMRATVGKGKIFKPVSGVDVNKKVLELQDIVAKNKYTLLEFWASWCSPCRAEIPVLKQAYKKHKNKGFEIYSYSIDASEDDWELALKEEKPTWIQTLGKGKQGEATMNSYAVDGIPASFLIDQNGKIIATNEKLRGENLDQLLSKLLK